MLIQSRLVWLAVICLVAMFYVLSCGSSAPSDQLTIHVPATHAYKSVRVDTCVAGAPVDDVQLDSKGVGKTSLCPRSGHIVAVQLDDGAWKQRISQTQVEVHRTGDGLATSIEVKLGN